MKNHYCAFGAFVNEHGDSNTDKWETPLLCAMYTNKSDYFTKKIVTNFLKNDFGKTAIEHNTPLIR
jgi:hypothetical protein